MSDPQPWTPQEGGQAVRRHAPATARNRDAIADVLAEVLPPTGRVLEVASGSGEHIVHFAARFPALHWQPSDPDVAALSSISAWSAGAGCANLAEPVMVDAAAQAWPDVGPVAAMLCINMVHISLWEATVGLFTHGGALLTVGAPLILYGPYIRAGHETAPSNLAFDASLKARNPAWGVRALEDVTALAKGRGFALDMVREMPANNLTLVYRRV